MGEDVPPLSDVRSAGGERRGGETGEESWWLVWIQKVRHTRGDNRRRRSMRLLTCYAWPGSCSWFHRIACCSCTWWDRIALAVGRLELKPLMANKRCSLSVRKTSKQTESNSHSHPRLHRTQEVNDLHSFAELSERRQVRVGGGRVHVIDERQALADVRVQPVAEVHIK